MAVLCQGHDIVLILCIPTAFCEAVSGACETQTWGFDDCTWSIFAGHLGTAKTLVHPICFTDWAYQGMGKNLFNQVRNARRWLNKQLYAQLWFRVIITCFVLLNAGLPTLWIHWLWHPKGDILTYVDLCTHWVEVVPLKYLTTEQMSIFYRVGFPDVFLSDNGSKFVSRAMW